MPTLSEFFGIIIRMYWDDHPPPPVVAAWSIAKFKILTNYQIQVEFADGTAGIADLSPRLSQGPLGDGYDPLCDQKLFAQAYLEHGALTWPGGIDLAPDAMYQRIRATGVSELAPKTNK